MSRYLSSITTGAWRALMFATVFGVSLIASLGVTTRTALAHGYHCYASRGHYHPTACRGRGRSWRGRGWRGRGRSWRGRGRGWRGRGRGWR